MYVMLAMVKLASAAKSAKVEKGGRWTGRLGDLNRGDWLPDLHQDAHYPSHLVPHFTK